jgi:hypothetical protein
MQMTPSKPLLIRFSGNRAVLSLVPILTVIFLATGFPIAAFSADDQCEGLFSDSSVEASERRKQMIQQYSKGARNFSEVRNFALKAVALPYSEKQTVLLDLGAIYRAVPKKDPNPTAAVHIGGRRLLDYAQTLIARTDTFFKSEISRGTPVAQAYGKFMKHQQELFASNYGASEVFVIVQTLQKNLQALQPAGHSGTPYKLLLAGSFINGKANLQKSDIDMTLSSPSLMSELPSWEKQVNEALTDSLGGGLARMVLEGHSEPASFYGRINPIVIEITRDTVQILVFAPATVRQKADELTAGAYESYLFTNLLTNPSVGSNGK